MSHLVLDHSVLAAMGTHQQVGELIARAHEREGRSLGVPALCLAAAEAEKSGLTRHVGYLRAVEVLDLTTQESGTVGALIALGFDWRKAHAVAVARNAGTPVVTLQPEGYALFGIETITLD